MMIVFGIIALGLFYILTGIYLVKESYLGKRNPYEPYQNPCDIMSGITLIILGAMMLWAILP